jgi:carbamoyltransferase
MGGVALNCVSNTKLYELCNNIWIMPNPGDAGNSLGAALSRNNDYRGTVEWEGPFLGTNIEGKYPCVSIVQELSKNKICGVANGRAEFGPRALGNRSLLADPRGVEVKDKVNEIKKRQKFRPFAPAILEEHLHEYFNIPTDKTPYMQFVAEARMKTKKEFPAIVHADGTARVQSVSKEDNSGFRELLEMWYAKTGCPMLLNTSLNIRGEPLVNTEKHAKDFEDKYNVKVFTKE